MTEPIVERATSGEMHCPTCNARQEWSDQCRRCKCDLSLLRQCWQTGETERRCCLRQLRAGRPDLALRYARRFARIVGAADAARLLGVCLLLGSHWSDAYAILCDTKRKDVTKKAAKEGHLQEKWTRRKLTTAGQDSLPKRR